MNQKDLKKIEKETLKTFKKQRPSEYFSHLNNEKAFLDHHKRTEKLFRFGIGLPPEFFKEKKIIDIGAGTGENTISLALWGAYCTLIEMNVEALNIAKEVFSQYTDNSSQHEFLNYSLYDENLRQFEGVFDIAHSRGVLMHVGDKKKAFKLLSSFVKPGGYVIYSDRNTCGGIQEMLQRMAIYSLGGESDESIIKVSEALFSKDIDRSQKAVPRTREAIIFDRWVIQQQDDPSIKEVLNMFKDEGLEFVNSWPKIDYLGRGTSTYSEPCNISNLIKGSKMIENLWMIMNNGEEENINSYISGKSDEEYFLKLSKIESSLRNHKVEIGSQVSEIKDLFQSLNCSDFGSNVDTPEKILNRVRTFVNEVIIFLDLVNNRMDLNLIRGKIDSFKVLFKGYTGVRDVNFLAYKTK